MLTSFGMRSEPGSESQKGSVPLSPSVSQPTSPETPVDSAPPFGFRKEPLTLESLPSLLLSLKGRLQVLVVCLSRAWGGLEQVAIHDALDVAALGISVRFLCLHGSTVHEHVEKYPQIWAVPLLFQPKNNFDFKLKKVLASLLEEGVNLIHLHQTSLLGSVVPWLWREPGVALLATRHILNDHNKNDFFHRALYRRLDSLMVVSESVRKNVLATHPLSQNRVKVVRLGLDFSEFDPRKVEASHQRAQWGVDADTVVIGSVGRIDPAKGQATFIKAAASLLKSAPVGQKLKFVIVGTQTAESGLDHLRELQNMVVQFHLENHVIFTGFLKNIPEVMKALDIFAMPSRQEAFGLVAIEAMAMGCPVVLSSGGSAEEIVGRQEYGLLTRPDDAFDLQRQLRVLIEKPTLRAQMGDQARQQVLKLYDRRMRVIQTLALYQRALRRRRALPSLNSLS
ncbi:MAG: glycosyltransferase family 4 protein [Bdellovibrionia bacterium]